MSSATSATLSVLLVEDSPLDGRLLLEALRPATQAGELVVQTVKRLGAAISELESVRFSCVLLDLGLPDGQGVDNVRALREVDSTAAIVVLTGLDDERSAGEALRLGAQDYLVKGEIDGERLMKLIRRAVQRNRQTLELEQQRDGSFFQASRDPLTLLPNQPLLLDRARLQLAEARGSGREFGMASLHLEGIDAARERYGAVVGDELLCKLAELLGEGLRGSDTLARLEGNRFALVLHPLNEPGALVEALHRLVRRVGQFRQIGNCAVQLELRAGLAIFSGGMESAEDLLERADRTARELPAGGAPVAGLGSDDGLLAPEVPTTTATVGAVESRRWQPWIDIETGQCTGIELLESPDLPAAEAEPAAAHCLASAQQLLQQWQAWQQTGFQPDCLALNVPAAALRARGFTSRLHALLVGAGLSPERLQLEIEDSAFGLPFEHQAALLALHADGYRLVLDGAGGGDLGLAALARVPLSGLKLGRPLLRQLLEENLRGAARRYIGALLGAAQGLGVSVIATGVESPEMLATLRTLGLRWVQGERLVPALEAHLVPVQWPRPVRIG